MAICGKWWSAFQAWDILGFRWNHFQMDRCNDQGARRSNSHWYLGGSSTGCEVKFFNLTLRAMRAKVVLKAARFSEIKGKTWDIYGKFMNIAPQFWHPCTFFDRSPRLIRPHVQMSRALRPCLSAQAWCESCGHGLQIAKAQTMEDLQEPRPSHQHLAACVTERCMLQSLVRNQVCTWKATGKIMSFCREIKRTWSCYGSMVVQGQGFANSFPNGFQGRKVLKKIDTCRKLQITIGWSPCISWGSCHGPGDLTDPMMADPNEGWLRFARIVVLVVSDSPKT